MQLGSLYYEVVTRSYDQFCGIARALDLVGERWALLVVRDLVLGPKRFTDLKRGLPGIGTNVLAARLKELEESLLAFGRWGARTLGMRAPGQALRSEWLAVALKAFFRPEAARGLRRTVRFRFEDDSFSALIERGRLVVEPGADKGADLVLTTDPETLVGFLAGAPVPAAALAPEGDLELLDRLPQIFAFATG